MIYVLIKDNVVTNTIIADSFFIDSNLHLYDTALPFDENGWYPSPGYTYDGTNFYPPVEGDSNGT